MTHLTLLWKWGGMMNDSLWMMSAAEQHTAYSIHPPIAQSARRPIRGMPTRAGDTICSWPHKAESLSHRASHFATSPLILANGLRVLF
jgi:hypothetical protein